MSPNMNFIDKVKVTKHTGLYMGSDTLTFVFDFENGQKISMYFDTGNDEYFTSTSSFNGELITDRKIYYGRGIDVCWDDIESITKKAYLIQEKDLYFITK